MASTTPIGAAIFSDGFSVLASDALLVMIISSDALAFMIITSDALVVIMVAARNALLFMIIVASDDLIFMSMISVASITPTGKAMLKVFGA